MPSESELRERLHAAGDPHDRIDVDAVLRRARRRRRPLVVATVAVPTLAVLAVIVPVSIGVLDAVHLGSSGSAASAPGIAAPQKDAASGGVGLQQAPANKVNLCTGTVTEVPPAENGLQLTVGPVTAAASEHDIPVTVTLTNSGSTAFHGIASPYPAVTLSRGGIVLWHSNGAVPSLAQAIDLAPGASQTFSTSFEPLVCGVSDDEHESFRSDLPQAGPGSYQLSATLDVSGNDGTSELVGGPSTTVTLR